jgi:hypothetical protein
MAETKNQDASVLREVFLARVRAACIKANPERDWRGRQWIEEPVRLADVLLALKGNANIAIDELGYFMEAEDSTRDNNLYSKVYQGRCWNLRQDDLTLQSDECVSFLASLLQ